MSDENTLSYEETGMVESSSQHAEETRITEHASGHDELHSDETVLFGRTFPFPIYTLVFFGLAILTITEVIMAELLGGIEPVKVVVLLGIAIAKALLVVIYYMHLNTDSRIFAISLAVPVGIALLSTLFLVAIPSGGY